MPIPQRSLSISHWPAPSKLAAEITIWPAHERDDASIDRDMRDRLSIGVYIGVATFALRPTPAEARSLIEALEWALAEPAGRS